MDLPVNLIWLHPAYGRGELQFLANEWWFQIENNLKKTGANKRIKINSIAIGKISGELPKQKSEFTINEWHKFNVQLNNCCLNVSMVGKVSMQKIAPR